jgi:hypothetical protein
VYYPSFFRLKRYGATAGLVGATIIVFLGTWLLHSYQWFWLRGGFPLEPQDGLFWGVLGALVVMGALGEMKRSRPRKLGAAKPKWSWTLAWKTAATFSAICVLWSLWSAESLATWLVMWGAAGHASAAELATLAGLLAAGLVVAGWPWSISDAGRSAPEGRLGWRAAAPALMLAAVIVLGHRELYAPAAPKLAEWVGSLQRSTLSARDAALQHKGYYEKLDNASRLSAQLWDVGAQRPAHWGSLGEVGAYRDRADFLGGELPENLRVSFLDQPLSTNSWGMRDRERALNKPAGVVRIAVLGPSHVMGSGVADADTFTRQLEELLNRSAVPGANFEVLNFGVAAYALTQQLAALQAKVLRFKPDIVVFTDSPRLGSPAVQHLLRAIAAKHDHPYPALAEVTRRSGVHLLGDSGPALPFDWLRRAMAKAGLAARMPWAEADQRLRRSTDEVIRATLLEAAALTRRHGAVPVFLALDNVIAAPEAKPRALDDARAAGMVVFDLLDLWEARRALETLRIAQWDNHPNALGNRIIADQLHLLLQQSRERLQMLQPRAANPR